MEKQVVKIRMMATSKSDVIIPLAGGLGNQLFQFAFGLYLERVLGYKVTFDCDLGTPRKVDDSVVLSRLDIPDIEKFCLKEQKLFKRILRKCYGWNLVHALKVNSKTTVKSLTIKTLSQSFLRIFFGRGRFIYSAKDLGFDESLSIQKNSLYIGYFQTYIFAGNSKVYEYLKCIKLKGTSKKYFKILNQIHKQKPFLVHIRLTDYTSEKNFGIPSLDYYNEAIRHLRQNSCSRPIWVISDDIGQARTYFSSISNEFKMKFLDQRDLSDLEVWSLMREFSGYVLSNSSFAWWAAFLRKDAASKVYAPEPWFHGMNSPNHLLPKSWVRVRSW
jgi:hypothetical protein